MTHIKKLTNLLLVTLILFGHNVGTPAIPRECVLNPDTLTQALPQDTLPELTVEKSVVEHKGKTDTYLITKEMRGDAREAGDILGKISGMHYNPLTKALSYLGSGNVKILVDSLERDDDYIKRLNPDRFIKVNITNFPSGKYSGYDVVVNLVTKPLYVGYDGVVIGETRIRPGHNNGKGRNISYWRGIVQATYTREKWNFAFSGYDNGGQEAERRWGEEVFPLNNYYRKNLKTDYSDPNYVSHSNTANFSLWTDYKISDSHSLSLGLFANPSFSKNVNRNMIISGIPEETATEELQTKRNSDHGSFARAAILQYRGKAGLWSIDASAQYTRTSVDRLSSVERSSFRIEDNRHLANDFVWGGIDLSRSFLDSRLGLTLSDHATWTRYTEMGIPDGNLLTSSKDFRNALTAGIQYNPAWNWGIGADIGFNIINSSYADGKSTNVTPRFGLNAMWSSSKVMVRLNYTASTFYPTLAQQQDFGRFTDSLIYSAGNPNLKPNLYHRISAMVNILRNLTISGEYCYSSNMIYNIAGTREGVRPDGINGYYVAFQPHNGRLSNWKANVTYNKTFNRKWTVSVSASVDGRRTVYENERKSRILPSYNWYLMYNSGRHAFQAYLSSSLESGLAISPQSVSWTRSDSYALSLVKFLFSHRLQIVAMWTMPIHMIKKSNRSELISKGYHRVSENDRYRRDDNQINLTLVWRFQGGSKTRSYSRRNESINIY